MRKIAHPHEKSQRLFCRHVPKAKSHDGKVQQKRGEGAPHRGEKSNKDAALTHSGTPPHPNPQRRPTHPHPLAPKWISPRPKEDQPPSQRRSAPVPTSISRRPKVDQPPSRSGSAAKPKWISPRPEVDQPLIRGRSAAKPGWGGCRTPSTWQSCRRQPTPNPPQSAQSAVPPSPSIQSRAGHARAPLCVLCVRCDCPSPSCFVSPVSPFVRSVISPVVHPVPRGPRPRFPLCPLCPL